MPLTMTMISTKVRKVTNRIPPIYFMKPLFKAAFLLPNFSMPKGASVIADMTSDILYMRYL